MPATTLLLFAALAGLMLERLVELAVSSRNTRRARAAGAVEVGRGHYPVMVLFHSAFLVGCAVEPILLPRPWPLAAALTALAAALLAQGLRWWAVASLGGRWTTRVLVRPGAPPVVTGPYRWLRHPNYLAVAVELLAVPLIGGALQTALLATAGNALLMAVRIPAEERALGPAWSAAFGAKRRGPHGPAGPARPHGPGGAP